MTEKQYLSKEKYKELGEELNFLKTKKRKDLADKLEHAKSLGDLSENAEYQEAREEQANTEKRILDLEEILKNAVMVEKHHSNAVEVGAVVIVKKEGEKEEKKFQIVGSEEADTSSGKISNNSPLGASLMNKKKGDIASFKTPLGEVKYKIINIE